jgi:hypothetical protein
MKRKLNFILLVALLLVIQLLPKTGLCGGPVIISGLDTEYGIRPGNSTHGTIAMWASVINTGILSNVTSCGSLVNTAGNILVIGGGKGPFATDQMTNFWTQIGTNLSRSITFVNGAAGISSQSFTGFSMIAVCNTTDGVGKLTSAELVAISARQNDIANFVNCGGGLFASACDLAPVYGYINIGTPALISVTGGGNNSTPTALGTSMGIPSVSGPYHNTFSQWPAFLSVLSNLSGNRACILGGKNVTITPPADPCCPPWNKDLLKSMMLYQGSGSISDPYTLRFQPTTALKNQMQAYINYLHSLNALMTGITIDWRLHDQNSLGNPPFTSYGPQVGSTAFVTWNWNTTGIGNPVVPVIFTGFPMQVGRWYIIHTGIYLENGQSFFPASCGNNDIAVRIQVMNSLKAMPGKAPARVLEISDGKKITTVPLEQDPNTIKNIP